jgi:hypothetical protein
VRVLTTDIVTRFNTYCSMIIAQSECSVTIKTLPDDTYGAMLSSSSGFAVLEETDLPEDFRVAGAPYLGPELTVDMD